MDYSKDIIRPFLEKIGKKYNIRRFSVFTITGFIVFITLVTLSVGMIYYWNVINYVTDLIKDNNIVMADRISSMFDTLEANIDDVSVDRSGRIMLNNGPKEIDEFLEDLLESDGFIRYFLVDDGGESFYIPVNSRQYDVNKIYAQYHNDVPGFYSSFGLTHVEQETYFVVPGRLNDHTELFSFLPYSFVGKLTSGIMRVIIIIFLLLNLVFVFAVRLMTWMAIYFEENSKARHTALVAEASNAAKSDFLSNMSHEIRTPVNTMLGMNEMILRTSPDPQILDYAKNIQSSGKILLNLINDILDFSKIESGKFTLVPSRYSLSSVLSDISVAFKEKAKDKGITLTLEADPSIPDCLYGDSLRVSQIFSNLLSNAVKYTDKGSIKCLVDGEMAPDALVLRIQVSDTGKGIRQEDIKNLFTEFERADLVSNNTIEGTGLGLAITKTLVAEMDGEIKVESTYGAGSVFTVHIKQMVLDPAPIGTIKANNPEDISKEYKPLFRAPECRVLIVDDTDMNLFVIKELLKETGIIIDTADSGLKCLELMRDIRYDLVLLDIRMPNMSGKETLEHIKSEHLGEGIPIIALTADAVEGSKDKYIDMGFSGYLSKPVDPPVLEMTLASYLPKAKVKICERKEDSSYSGDLPDALFSIKEIEVADGIRYCGTPRIYLDTISRYSSRLAENLRDIKKALAMNDIQEFTIKVHALKSASQSIGCRELYEGFRSMEDAGNKKNIGFIEAGIDDLLTLYEKICIRLKAINSQNDKTGITIDKESLRGIYTHLKEYVDDLNDEAITSMLGALKKYDFPGEEQDRFDSILDSFEKADWVRLAEIMKEAVD